jgi:hypothetical protein
MATLWSLMRSAIDEHFEDRVFISSDFAKFPGFNQFPRKDVARALNTMERHGFIERMEEPSASGLIRWRKIQRPKKFSERASLVLQDLLIGRWGANEFLFQQRSKSPSIIHSSVR